MFSEVFGFGYRNGTVYELAKGHPDKIMTTKTGGIIYENHFFGGGQHGICP